MLLDIIREKNISVYSLAKGANIPYTTVNEIVLDKKNIMDCSIKTIMSIANYLGYQTDDFIDKINQKPVILANNWEESKTKSFIFPVIANNKNYQANRIHPLKQKTINELYYSVSKNKKIKKVILFGSSINIRCHNASDIDLAIELFDDDIATKNIVSEQIQEKCDYNADIIWLNSISKDTDLYNNIQGGITIYE